MWIGIMGALLILIAWAFEMFESVEKHKQLIDARFTFIYLAGVVLMLLYSISELDSVFIFLNGAIITLVAFEIFYTVFFLKKRKHINKPGK